MADEFSTQTRRRTNIRLAITIGMIAVGFYLGFIFLSTK